MAQRGPTSPGALVTREATPYSRLPGGLGRVMQSLGRSTWTRRTALGATLERFGLSGVALESLWSRSRTSPVARRHTRVALESPSGDQFRPPRCGLFGHELSSGGERAAAPAPHRCRALFGARESPLESPGVHGKASGCTAGAQQARSERTAGGSTDRFWPSRCGLLLHELWPRCRARRLCPLRMRLHRQIKCPAGAQESL